VSEDDFIEPDTRAEWRSWLAEHHSDSRGVWVAVRKGRDAQPSYDDIVEEALAFGWIDSKAKRLDERRYKQWLSPRRPGGNWAQSNKARVARLIESGQMTEAGMAAVEAAKADGSWEALDAVDALEVPSDLARALDANPAARAFYDAFPDSAKRMILWRVASAKRPETRQRRIEETVRLAAENERAHG